MTLRGLLLLMGALIAFILNVFLLYRIYGTGGFPFALQPLSSRSPLHEFRIFASASCRDVVFMIRFINKALRAASFRISPELISEVEA